MPFFFMLFSICPCRGRLSGDYSAIDVLGERVTQTFAEELTFIHEQSRRAFYPYDWTRI